MAELLSILVDCPDTLLKTITPFHKKLFTWREFHRELEQALGKKILYLRIPAPLVKLGGFVSEVTSAISGQTPFFTREKTREILADYSIADRLKVIEEMTGWKADTPLKEALEETLKWAAE